MRDGLEHLFDAVDGFSVLGSFSTPKAMTQCLEAFQVDVVVMEVLFGGCDVLREIAEWSREYTDTQILVLSQFPEEVYAERVLSAGARGYLMKDHPSSALIEGVRKVNQGEVALSATMANRLLSNYSRKKNLTNTEPHAELAALSDREILVLTLVGQGYPTARIAEEMGISKKTVSTFKERIKVKLALENSIQLSQVAMQWFGRST